MGIILTPLAPILGILSLFGFGGFNAWTCEKALEFHQENTPKLERQIAELEREKMENASTVARLEHAIRVLQGVREENTQLRQESGSLRERLEAALLEHHTLVVGQSKISKDTQADMGDLRQWAEKELQKKADAVHNVNVTRWHEKTEYGKKLAEYQRLLRQAAAESGGLRKEIAQVKNDLATARGDLGRAQSDLATANQNLDKMRQTVQKDLAEKDAKHQEDIQKISKRYRLGFVVLGILFAVTLIALIVVLLRRRTS